MPGRGWDYEAMAEAATVCRNQSLCRDTQLRCNSISNKARHAGTCMSLAAGKARLRSSLPDA